MTTSEDGVTPPVAVGDRDGRPLGQAERPGARGLAQSRRKNAPRRWGAILSARSGGHASLFAVPSGRLLRATPGPPASPRPSFSPDGRLLVTGGLDHTAAIWDVKSGRRLHMLADHKQAVTDVLFGPDGKVIATTSADGPRSPDLGCADGGEACDHDRSRERGQCGLVQPGRAVPPHGEQGRHRTRLGGGDRPSLGGPARPHRWGRSRSIRPRRLRSRHRERGRHRPRLGSGHRARVSRAQDHLGGRSGRPRSVRTAASCSRGATTAAARILTGGGKVSPPHAAAIQPP